LAEPDTQRSPLVIKGEMKKLALVPAALPPAEQQKRRRAVNLIGMGFVLLTIVLTILTATPLGHEVGLDFPALQFGSSFFDNPNHGPGSLIAQATATAIYHQHNDGYDPFARGSQIIGDGLHSLGWPVGQCTYWASLRYQQLTGFWVPWNGNADQWVAGARLAHWHISSQPHVPSIMVLMPYVQNASGYGHVAVVENIVPNSNPPAVETSNMNWYSNGGGFNKESTVNFTVGPGTYFVWHS
ncbi:MAG: CHAP domain-containing protein, partial [Ktedonobacteraceae bacterium]